MANHHTQKSRCIAATAFIISIIPTLQWNLLPIKVHDQSCYRLGKCSFLGHIFRYRVFSYRLGILVGSNSSQSKRDYYSLGMLIIITHYLYFGFLKCQPLPTGHL